MNALIAAAHPAALHTASDPSIASSLGRMVLGLGGVIVSILVVSKVLQYLRRGAGPRRNATSALEVVSRQSLGKGLQLAVVRFNGREVLVGIAGQQITFHETAGGALEGELALLEAEELTASAAPAQKPTLAGLLAGAQATNGGAPSFLDRLRDATTRR